MSILIRPTEDNDRDWMESVFREHWGANFIVSRGKKHFVDCLNGFCCVDSDSTPVGLATYRIENSECELVSLNAFNRLTGVGTLLTEAVRRAAESRGCTRLWLITTNDNLDAFRFYQRRGFALVAVYPHAIDVSRQLKPSIPMFGQFGISLSDEVEFEIRFER